MNYVYCKGSSSYRALFDLVLRLGKVQQKGGLVLYVVYVTETRMAQSGVDDLPRGETGEEVVRGKEMISFIPLYSNALEKSDGFICAWI